MGLELPTGRPRIVIIGGGFGGAYCAQALERKLGAGDADVVLLDHKNYFTFSPLLVEAGTGSLEPRHAVVSIRSFVKRTRFVMGQVTRVDLERREVSYCVPGDGTEKLLSYDQLVLAVGSVSRLPDVPGLARFGFEMKSLADAVSLRDRAIRQLEIADACESAADRRRALHFVVVGASFTGVEVAGELHDFLCDACRHYRNLQSDDVSFTLIELGQRILPALDEDLAAYAMSKMIRRGIEIELGTSVASVTEKQVCLDNGRELAAETLIWCAGIAPNPLVEKTALPTDARGYILCDQDLRVQGCEQVWAIGDSAVNIDPSGKAYPATAQHAVQQGRHLAGNLVRVLRGKPSRPCDIRTRGTLAALGCRTGVAKVFGIKLSGFAAWFLWRTVYLLTMPGLARRLRVGIDWTMGLLFAKDSVQLGLIKPMQSLPEQDHTSTTASEP